MYIERANLIDGRPQITEKITAKFADLGRLFFYVLNKSTNRIA